MGLRKTYNKFSQNEKSQMLIFYHEKNLQLLKYSSEHTCKKRHGKTFKNMFSPKMLKASIIGMKYLYSVRILNGKKSWNLFFTICELCYQISYEYGIHEIRLGDIEGPPKNSSPWWIAHSALNQFLFRKISSRLNVNNVG